MLLVGNTLLLSNSFPKYIFFLCDPGSISVVCQCDSDLQKQQIPLWFLTCFLSLTLFFDIPNPFPGLNSVLPNYLDSTECCMLSLLQVLVHGFSSSLNILSLVPFTHSSVSMSAPSRSFCWYSNNGLSPLVGL